MKINCPYCDSEMFVDEETNGSIVEFMCPHCNKNFDVSYDDPKIEPEHSKFKLKSKIKQNHKQRRHSKNQTKMPKRSRFTVVRFLANAYELFITIMFILSLVGYIFIIISAFITWLALIGKGDEDITTWGTVGLTIQIILATIIEAIFLIILGGAALMVDIRNILIEQHNKLEKK